MSNVTKGARKALIWLGAIFVVIYGALTLGVLTNHTVWTPGLALDLAGGRQIILTPVLEDGAEQEIDQADLEQAVEIIRRRIDATGVAEAEITTQGNNIVVALPGNPDENTVDLVAQSAQLQFRPVLVQGNPGPTTLTTTEPTAVPSPSPSLTSQDSETVEPAEDEVSAPEASPSPTASEVSNVVTVEPATASATSVELSASPEPALISEEPAAEASQEPVVTSAELPVSEPVFGETDPSSFEWLTPAVEEEFAALDCTNPDNFSGRSMGDPETGYSACDLYYPVKYAMGPVELSGDDLVTATSGPQYTQQGTLTGAYEVRLQFTSEGAQKFDTITSRIKDLEAPRNQFAAVLDGVVISAPSVNERIPNGEAVITGQFTQEQAEQLANQLKFGALPLSLEVQSNQQISATLGADQLQKGLIAGAIGLLLVVIYSLFQYRALAVVTIGSLAIAGGLTYGIITLLSWGLGYRLSLAGVAGLIVAIGITADSFIVYFERIRDELREGRSLQSAIDHAWKRARRTILASDAVSLLAAVTLYVLAVGGVRGFAFTLGLTTLVDVLVVFLFTHPIMVLLGKTKFFGNGHKWSGLDPRQLGRDTMYKGRGRVVVNTAAPTLAERKAAERRGATAKTDAPEDSDTAPDALDAPASKDKE